MPKITPPTVSLSQDQIARHLKDQLDHLGSTCSRFDKGDTREYRRIAATIRLLAYHRGMSHSLLNQAGYTTRRFVNSACSLQQGNEVSECNLIMLRFSSNSPYASWVAGLDDVPLEFIDFDDWWNQPIMSDQVHPPLTRATLTLHVANQDGGAHVDPAIDAAFDKIRRDGFKWSNGREVTQYPERHAIRQIGHEILKSLRHSYRRRTAGSQKWIYSRGISVVKGKPPDASEIVSYHFTSGTDFCPCNSGKLFVKCHAKGALAPLPFQIGNGKVTPPENTAYARIGLHYT